MLPLSDNNPTTHPPIITVAIIIINFAALLWLINLPAPRQEQVVVEHGFVPRRITQLTDHKPIVVTVDHKEVRRGQLQLVENKYQLDPVPSQIYASLAP